MPSPEEPTKNGRCKCPGCGGLWVTSMPPPQRMTCLRCGTEFEPVVLRVEKGGDNNSGDK